LPSRRARCARSRVPRSGIVNLLSLLVCRLSGDYTRPRRSAVATISVRDPTSSSARIFSR
jgi:hypothetical protein